MFMKAHGLGVGGPHGNDIRAHGIVVQGQGRLKTLVCSIATYSSYYCIRNSLVYLQYVGNQHDIAMCIHIPYP